MKLVKYIALTHTPSTHIVCLPVKMVRELDLLKDNTVQIKLDDDKIIIEKVKE
jgi:antitoxin component of MazEF toxin-antitoxin module